LSTAGPAAWVALAAVPTAPFDPIHEARRQWVDHALGEPVAMAAATSIIRVQQLISSQVEAALRPMNLTFARYEVLMLLRFARKGELPMTKMGERLMVHPTGISKLVDKLEQQGLVTRQPNPLDRRGTLARVTPAGKRLAARATEAVTAVRFGATLDDARLEDLLALLTDLRHRAGDF
jgi:DNA-binding MarR family transcriptional regulator